MRSKDIRVTDMPAWPPIGKFFPFFESPSCTLTSTPSNASTNTPTGESQKVSITELDVASRAKLSCHRYVKVEFRQRFLSILVEVQL
jgi:hypothetical protein